MRRAVQSSRHAQTSHPAGRHRSCSPADVNDNPWDRSVGALLNSTPETALAMRPPKLPRGNSTTQSQPISDSGRVSTTPPGSCSPPPPAYHAARTGTEATGTHSISSSSPLACSKTPHPRCRSVHSASTAPEQSPSKTAPSSSPAPETVRRSHSRRRHGRASPTTSLSSRNSTSEAGEKTPSGPQAHVAPGREAKASHPLAIVIVRGPVVPGPSASTLRPWA